MPMEGRDFREDILRQDNRDHLLACFPIFYYQSDEVRPGLWPKLHKLMTSTICFRVLWNGSIITSLGQACGILKSLSVR